MTDFPGDPYSLEKLVLPRPACAYGLQQLGTDMLWSVTGRKFLSIRQIAAADLFAEFEAASLAGLDCLARHPDAALAIVPIAWDTTFSRFVLIQGVIPDDLTA